MIAPSLRGGWELSGEAKEVWEERLGKNSDRVLCCQMVVGICRMLGRWGLDCRRAPVSCVLNVQTKLPQWSFWRKRLTVTSWWWWMEMVDGVMAPHGDAVDGVDTLCCFEIGRQWLHDFMWWTMWWQWLRGDVMDGEDTLGSLVTGQQWLHDDVVDDAMTVTSWWCSGWWGYHGVFWRRLTVTSWRCCEWCENTIVAWCDIDFMVMWWMIWKYNGLLWNGLTLTSWWCSGWRENTMVA